MKNAKKLVILGTAGNSIDLLDIIADINIRKRRIVYKCVGFLDDNPSLHGKKLHGVKVLGPLAAAAELRDCYFVNGIGSPTNFWRKAAIIHKTGVPLKKFVTIIHPSASVSKTARIGSGTVVFQNVVIGSNATVGNHVIVLPNAVISHDVDVDDFACITGGVCISGGTKIGKSSYLGTNCSIIGDIKIGGGCLIGMGSVVLDSIADNSVVVGSPARFLRNTV
jgi:sugar O-acyltransferase (sialic acid O-acetyltransferase NeuD family)